jgi:hypothetical protein
VFDLPQRTGEILQFGRIQRKIVQEVGKVKKLSYNKSEGGVEDESSPPVSYDAGRHGVKKPS